LGRPDAKLLEGVRFVGTLEHQGLILVSEDDNSDYLGFSASASCGRPRSKVRNVYSLMETLLGSGAVAPFS